MASAKNKKSKKGFTIIEVSLVLAVTGLMLIGVLGGTYLSITSQRYNDSLRNFADYMRSMYAEALSPESITENETTMIGNSTDQAILGKVIVFGVNGESTVYSATLVGSADIHKSTNQSFLSEITDTDLTKTSVFCGDITNDRPSSVQSYIMLWEAQLAQATGIPTGAKYKDPFVGTMIIARTPTSGTIHTAFAPGKTYDFANDCVSENAKFQMDLAEQHNGFATYYRIDEPTGICVVSDDLRVHREVRIAADGRNASAVWLRQDDEENACRPE